MGDEQNRAAVERYFRGVTDKDFEALDALRHDDFVQEWSQMGERTRGRANAKAINENHPGTPKATVRRLFGGGDLWIAETDLAYPDGSVWKAVNIFEFKDGKILKQTDYFGAPIAAPAWRARWVERME